MKWIALESPTSIAKKASSTDQMTFEATLEEL